MRILPVSAIVALSLVAVYCDNLIENGDGSATRTVFHSNLSTPEECARDCKEGEQPLTCYYHFTAEYYSTLTEACTLCRSNTTTGLTPDCQCITADGYEKSGIITANRQYPGPSIMVCKNDYLVIDVANKVFGNGITIHWHGVFQKNYQYYDGAPYVTQCPIGEGATFRYQWQAANAGTHFWHAHTGLHMANGLLGPLIIREPKSNETNHELWDHDRNEDFIFIDDWFHDTAEAHFPGNIARVPGQFPDNILINGKGQWTDPISGNVTTTPLAVYTVEARQRYRFRLINSGSLVCAVQMTIQGHNLTVIASDGVHLEPFNVTSITSFSGERYDFIINTNQIEASYWIQFRGTGRCADQKMQQVAILRYNTAPAEPELEKPSYDIGIPTGIVLNPSNIRCNGAPNATNAVCVNKLKSANPLPPRILQKEPDLRIFLPFSVYTYPLEDIFKVGTYNKYVVIGRQAVALVGNISNTLPSSPPLSQRQDIPDSQLCSTATGPAKCNGTVPCQCLHIEDIPLNAVVELVLIDEDHTTSMSHPFHLHGQTFYVMGEAQADDFGVKKMTMDIAKDLHKRGLIKRNYDKPPAKDTYAVPDNGITVIRILAENPGYWLFHCHFTYHLYMGMSLLLHVGEDMDLPPIPEGFPKCGNFVPNVTNNGVTNRLFQ